MFYSGLGNANESYTDEAFVEMISKAVVWASQR